MLIVDDDVVTTELMAHLLEEKGFAVARAHSANEARIQLATTAPELVLLDVVLPDVDGRELCREIKADQRTRNAFVILISGQQIGTQGLIHGLNLGADEYLPKPIQPQELIARLRSFLRIREANDALLRAKESLEDRVLQRTEELSLANAELQRATAELRSLSSRLLETQERERRRLAHELHDEAGQALTVLKFSFDNIEEIAAKQAPETVAEGRAALTKLTQLIRNLWQELRPAMLEDFGLVPAIVWYADRFTLSTRIKVDLQHEGVDGQRFPRDLEIALYRTIQEALTNVARHAGVREVRVLLCAGTGLLQAQVVDAGRGFDPAAGLSRNGSCGLVGMQERVRLLHGRLNLSSQPGAGTRVCVEFSLAETDSASALMNGAAVPEAFPSVDNHPTPTESIAHATLP